MNFFTEYSMKHSLCRW